MPFESGFVGMDRASGHPSSWELFCPDAARRNSAGRAHSSLNLRRVAGDFLLWIKRISLAQSMASSASLPRQALLRGDDAAYGHAGGEGFFLPGTFEMHGFGGHVGVFEAGSGVEEDYLVGGF